MPYVNRDIKIPGHYKIIDGKRIWNKNYIKTVRVWIPKSSENYGITHNQLEGGKK